MPRTELVKTDSKFRDIGSIMKDEEAKTRLMNMVDEAAKCKEAIALQQQNIKVLRDAARTDLEMSPKLFNAFVSAAFNNDYAQRKAGLEEQVTMLEHIMGEVGLLTDGDE